jgi:hypothetical protein
MIAVLAGMLVAPMAHGQANPPAIAAPAQDAAHKAFHALAYKEHDTKALGYYAFDPAVKGETTAEDIAIHGKSDASGTSIESWAHRAGLDRYLDAATITRLHIIAVRHVDMPPEGLTAVQATFYSGNDKVAVYSYLPRFKRFRKHWSQNGYREELAVDHGDTLAYRTQEQDVPSHQDSIREVKLLPGGKIAVERVKLRKGRIAHKEKQVVTPEQVLGKAAK